MVGGGKDREEMRLIDADALIKTKQEEYSYYDITDSEFEDLVNSQPTAFDTEKVVEQLEVLHDLVNDNQKLAVSQSIDIVKKGGVE